MRLAEGRDTDIRIESIYIEDIYLWKHYIDPIHFVNASTYTGAERYAFALLQEEKSMNRSGSVLRQDVEV